MSTEREKARHGVLSMPMAPADPYAVRGLDDLSGADTCCDETSGRLAPPPNIHTLHSSKSFSNNCVPRVLWR